MVKPLSFKGDKKPKKRKRVVDPDASNADGPSDLARTAPAARPDDDGEDDHSWVSAEALTDLVGPVMLVLPTEPVTCLACDPNGKVFADEVVNIIDGNPSSAEPHDVRQVWVVNKIVGTEHFRFKGRYGKFLSCDQYGVLSATSEAVSPPETWTVVPTADAAGTFQLQTQRETFLTAKEPTKAGAAPSVRGDATDIGFETTLRIRMQARFKPKLKASKEEKAKEKISRKALEEAAGRRLEEDEVRLLKKARREGDYHEQLLNLKQKSKHDKYG
ncbi:FRG1-like family-domain-containing protein [Microdochium trichocladiopsis]|uniref:FRG1-like family-domain-containing protein n=1 Tax=Microdochium trichocladiopsis TaxID=1682393 RepID=A0A9P8XXM7_9PEZI|nr:FRG1-like family-domain-containing protein [Microdochium trichocladiopsis]KAH7018372.1 FRG1-like family-domain-containing protein [Microdochium trichocladiopsis]